MTIFRIHAYITLMNWSQFCVTLCYDCYMMNRIRHNSPSPIHCLPAFHILFFTYQFSVVIVIITIKHQKYYFCYCYLLPPLPLLSYYFATKYLAKYIKFPGVVELTTQLLIFENILWLPLCRINKFGLNTLPSKTVVILYTCGLSIMSSDQLVCDVSLMKTMIMTRCYMTMMYYDGKLLRI